MLPQVVKRILPSMGNEVITLVKDTSLAFSIGVIEMFSAAKATGRLAGQHDALRHRGRDLLGVQLLIVMLAGRRREKLDYYHD